MALGWLIPIFRKNAYEPKNLLAAAGTKWSFWQIRIHVNEGNTDLRLYQFNDLAEITWKTVRIKNVKNEDYTSWHQY